MPGRVHESPNGARMMDRRSVLRGATGLVAGTLASPMFVRSANAADVVDIVSWAGAGQRFGLTQSGMYPLFKENFPNINVQIATTPVADFLAKAAIAMSAKSDQYDTIQIDYVYLTQFIKQNALEPIEPFLDRDPEFKKNVLGDIPENVLDTYRDKPLAQGGTLYGLPPDSNVQLQYYRSDAFEKKGITKAPETWEEVIEVAKELSEGGSRKVVGTTLKRGIWSASVFLVLFRTYGGTVFDTMTPGGWKPQLDSDAGNKAFTVLLELLKYCDSTTLNAADDEVSSAMMSGAWEYAPLNWAGSSMNDPKFTEYADRWKATVVAKGESPDSRPSPHMGGHGLIMPSFSHHKEAAWEWMKFMVSSDTQYPGFDKLFVESTGQPARLSILERYSDVRPYYKALQDSLPYAVAFFAIPEAPAIYETIGTQVTDVGTGAKSPNDALKAMQADVTRIMTRGGYYK